MFIYFFILTLNALFFRIMITATRGDRKPADLHIFRNYKSPLELLNHVERDALTNEILPNPRGKFFNVYNLYYNYLNLKHFLKNILNLLYILC